MKCINESCNRDLTQFDINKHVRKFSKHRLCIYCRTHAKSVTKLKCLECGKSFEHNNQKLYCGECKHERRLKQERVRKWVKNHRKIKECVMCFGLIPLDSRKQKICSNECLLAYHRIMQINKPKLLN